MEQHKGACHELLSETSVQKRISKFSAQKLKEQMSTESIFHFHKEYETTSVPNTAAPY